MSPPRFESTQFSSSAFVESAGAIPFRLSTRTICVLHHQRSGEYLLAKGRRNCGEARRDAALREVREETGLRCRLLPVDMRTRAPPAEEPEGQHASGARVERGACEPIMVQMRGLRDGSIKLIWWYVAAVEEGVTVERDAVDEERYSVEFYN